MLLACPNEPASQRASELNRIGKRRSKKRKEKEKKKRNGTEHYHRPGSMFGLYSAHNVESPSPRRDPPIVTPHYICKLLTKYISRRSGKAKSCSSRCQGYRLYHVSVYMYISTVDYIHTYTVISICMCSIYTAYPVIYVQYPGMTSNGLYWKRHVTRTSRSDQQGDLPQVTTLRHKHAVYPRARRGGGECGRR